MNLGINRFSDLPGIVSVMFFMPQCPLLWLENWHRVVQRCVWFEGENKVILLLYGFAEVVLVAVS
jgi:hypothetical protein